MSCVLRYLPRRLACLSVLSLDLFILETNDSDAAQRCGFGFQVAIFVTPSLVIASMIMGRDLALDFPPFEVGNVLYVLRCVP